MPIQECLPLVTPTDTTILWRYMDFAKLSSMIFGRSLWFANAEVLALDDPWEAVVSPENYEFNRWGTDAPVPDRLLENMHALGANFLDGKSAVDVAKDSMKHIDYENLSARKKFFINCWFDGDCESIAMWKIYGNNSAGVACVTTMGNLKLSIADIIQPIYAGKVDYISDQDNHVQCNQFAPLVTKREEFSYENEIRLILHNSFSEGQGIIRGPDFRLPGSENCVASGVYVSCQLDELITELVISPFAPDWYKENVINLVAAVGLDIPVRRSTLLTAPMIGSPIRD